MKKKRYWVKGFKKILALALIIVAVIVASNVIYDVCFDNEAMDKKIESDYETEKETHELLRTIANDSIEEGKGIKINVFPSNSVQYEIYNYGENIIFSYQIDNGKLNTNIRIAQATIVLSNDFEVLDEGYSELQDFETYKQNVEKLLKGVSLFLVILLLFIVAIIIKIYPIFCEIYKNIKKEQVKTNKTTS